MRKSKIVQWISSWSFLLAVLFGASASAHEGTIARLDPDTLDDGIHVAVGHPRVIRDRAPFRITVAVENLMGRSAVTVAEVRYDAGDGGATTHSVVASLPSHRFAYRRLLALEEQLETATEARDSSVVARVLPERHRLLAEIYADGFEDGVEIDGTHISMERDAFEVRVEVDLVDAAGATRTLSRVATIPIHPPLPSGETAGERLRFDAETGSFTSERSRPAPPGGLGIWRSGDQHVHTTYSIDAAVFDGTSEDVFDYAAAADAGGHGWLIGTDHSNVDFDLLFLEWYTPEQFEAGAAEAAAYTAANDFVALNGQELGTGSTSILGMPSHYLAYPAQSDSTGYIANPCTEHLFKLAFCEAKQVIVDRVAAQGGIGFIAHPTDSAALYVPWDFGAGTTGWSGMEIWTGSLSDTDQTAYDTWHALLRKIGRPANGQLPERPAFPTRFPVAIGNSDAHTQDGVGATFTYADIADLSRQSIVDAFLGGRAVASNGPLLFAEINGAGLGEVAQDLEAGVSMDVTLQTTSEFGPTGDYTITVNVDGLPSVVIPPSGSPSFSTTIAVEGLGLAWPDKFVTIRADSLDGQWHAFTNPIWIEFAACPGDVNGDRLVNLMDLFIVKNSLGPCEGCPMDLNGDGVVDALDQMEVITNFGACSS